MPTVERKTWTHGPPKEASRSLLEIEDLAVSFDLGEQERVQAVNGVSLTVHAGQTLAIVGESGCGKSVSALSVLQLVPQPPGRLERGAIRFQGRDLLHLSPREMLNVRGREISMIFQEPMTSLNPVYSVGAQVAEAVRLHQDVDRRESFGLAIKAMEGVGIPNAARRVHDYPHQFSGGMQQRVMIAMALACRPRLLLADEPTTALDVTIQAQILSLLRDLQQSRQMAIMLITHDLHVVRETAHVVCVMYQGRVMEYARTRDLFAHAFHPYTRGLLSCIPRLDRRRPHLATVDDIMSDPDQYRRLPGAQYGIVPWWPDMDAPEEFEPGTDTYCLHEIQPEHWVGCWRTEFLRQHPNRRPDIG